MSTIYEIARAAGVSPKTVARILTDETAGRPGNRARVLAAAKRLNYVRNQQAANLRHGKSGLIGFILPDISNPIYPNFCKLLHDACLHFGYRLLLANSYGSAEEALGALKMFEMNRVEGIILDASEGEPDTLCDATLSSLLRRGVPIVLGGRPVRDLPLDAIVIQNAEAIAKAVKYLAKIGRKRIAFVCGNKDALASRERYQGYRNALKHCQLNFDPALVSFANFTLESGIQQAEALLKLASPPDAVMAANDLLAMGAIHAALERGLSVPQELAVVGFDDIPISQWVRPRLTTLRQPHERMARECVELLVQRIRTQNFSRPRKMSYDLELIVRESA